jgi:anti-sigma factor RsiW
VPEATHDTVAELLPWFATGTLSPDEQAMVERHIASCTSCTQELRLLHGVGSAFRALEADTQHPAPSLARTMAAIDRLESRRAPASRLASWVSWLWNPSASFARVALAAQLVLILALGSLVIVQRRNDQAFSTLSGESGAQSGARLTLTFVPTASEESIRQLLAEVRGEIVSGPSALGVYVVRLTGETDDPRIDAAVQRLRSRPAVVRFVEREP